MLQAPLFFFLQIQTIVHSFAQKVVPTGTVLADILQERINTNADSTVLIV